MTPPLPGYRYHEPTLREILAEYALKGIAIILFLLFTYLGYRLVKSANLPMWLSVVGYIFFALLSLILCYLLYSIPQALFGLAFRT